MIVKEQVRKERIDKEKEKQMKDIRRNAGRKCGKDKRIVIYMVGGQ